MSHVVCVMNVEEKRVTFTWSEGPADFKPYTLDGMDYTQFKRMAEAARGNLADLVKDYLYAEENVPQATFDLAKAGFELHESLFCPGDREAKQVRKWLEKLSQTDAVDTVEIVVDSPWSLPWNVIYDKPPTKDMFLGAEVSPDRWKPFWGLKFNMCGGGAVNPLRRLPILRDPHVLVVVDPHIRDGLPAEQRERLADFVDSHNLNAVHTKDELEAAIKDKRPDVLYWLSHASPEALMLSDEPVSPLDLRQLLAQEASDDVRFGGLAFLNSCQTAEFAGEEGSFFEAFHKAGFAGMIGTEHQTIDQFANPLGLDFLEAFLDGGETVGSAMRRLRGRVPLGLLYGTYCPPDTRVERGDPVDNVVEINQVSHVEGVALRIGAMAEPIALRHPSKPLPSEPYRSLGYYEREDRALFAGRDDDIERFAKYLDDASTRILVLHGESGVGKSSFLHAGAIPYLEEECLGYRFIRDRKADDSAGDQGSVIFIRATNDMVGQLAQALCEFCARPYEYQTPLGETVSADLPGVLTEFVGDTVNQSTVRGLLRADPAALGQLLATISNCLPFTAILVIDQGEEVFTLAQTAEDQKQGRQALEMLRRTVGAAGNFKVIFCLRTEYYGRVIDRLRRGLHDTGGIREYLLTDFDEDELFEAIRRPTDDELIPYASDVPFEKYGFRYAEGVAEEISHRVVRYAAQRRDSVLPLMQVICAQLYRLASSRTDNTITLSDLGTLGGIEGGMRNHVEGLLGELLKSHPLDKKHVQKLFTQLYLKQADGTLTTALLAEDEVQQRWTGRMPFGQLLESCRKLRLLKVNSLRIGMEEERHYVSLGHDALAKIAADWDEQLSRGARMRKMVAAIVVVSAVAVVMAVLSVLASKAKWTAEEQRAVAVEQKEIAEKQKAIAVEQTGIADEKTKVAVEATWEANRQTANACWQVATVARDRNFGIKAGHNFLRAAQACNHAGDETQQRDNELAAQFTTARLVRAFPHDSSVVGTQVSADESRVLSWSDDSTVKLWDVTKAEPLQVWQHEGVDDAVFTDDESRVLTHGGDAVKLWDVTQAEPLQVLQHEVVYGAVFTRDESRVLTRGGGTVKLWDVTQAEPLLVWQHEGVYGAVFTRDESRVLTRGGGTVKLWDVTKVEPLQVWQHEGVDDAVFTDDESRVLTRGGEAVKLWDVTQAEPLLVWQHEGVVGAMFTDDESRVLTWSGGYGSTGAVKLWSVTKAEPLQVWQHEGAVVGAAFTRDESRVLIWSDNNFEPGELKLFDVREAEPLQVWKHEGGVNGATFTDDESRVLAWSGRTIYKTPGELKLWDVTQAEPLQVWKHDGSVYTSVGGSVFTRDESRVLSWSNDSTVKLWDVTKAEPLQVWQHEGVDDAVFTDDESRVLTHGGDAVKLWDVTQAEPLQVWQHEGVYGAVFTRDESRVLTWSGGYHGSTGAVKLWSVTKAEPLLVWQHEGVDDAVFTDDESRVLTHGGDAVKLWDVTQAEPLLVWQHEGVVGAMFTDDESRVLTHGGDAVKLWDVTQAEPLLVWQHEGVVGAMFTDDESRVLTHGGDAVKLWDVTQAEPLLVWQHEGVVGAMFTDDESRVLTHGGDAVKLWSVTKAEPLQVWQHDKGVNGAVFTDDESHVLSWSGAPPDEDRSQEITPGAVKLFDVTKAEPLQTWQHEGAVNGAVFTDDESRVLAWSADGAVKFWDVTKADPLQVWKPEYYVIGGVVSGAVFTDNESRVLTWRGEGTVKLMSVTKAEPLQVWKHEGGVNGAVFTRDESRVLSWSTDGTVKLCDTALKDVDLTPTERIVELTVRSATRLDAAGQLVPLNADDWTAIVRSPEYATIQKKMEAADRSGRLILGDGNK